MTELLNPKPVIFISSMPRCGSMWAYNVTRALLLSSGLIPLPESIPPLDNQLLREVATIEAGEGRLWCVKTHRKIRPHADNIRVICPYRDVRDSLISYMNFRQSTFDQAMEALVEMMQITDWYLQDKQDNVHAVRYCDITERPVETVAAINKFLRLSVSAERIMGIVEGLSKEKVARHISKFEKDSMSADSKNRKTVVSVRNLDGNYRLYDTETGFQSGHIGSLRDGSWRTELTLEQCERLVERYGFL